MKKKILIISPTPTHPTTAGNRSRILSNAVLLRERGMEVHFLLAAHEPYDLELLKNFWGESLFLYDENKYAHLQSLQKKASLHRRIRFKVGRHLNINSLKYNKYVDDYYPQALDFYLKNHLLQFTYDVVIVEYVVFSKAFLLFDNRILKILDAHDRFSNRYLTYLKNKLVPNWYSLFPAEEKKGLNRSDVVLAIQEHEAEYFRNITSKKVIVLGHVVRFQNCRNSSASKLLFVASDNIINVQAIQHFIEEIFPKVLLQIPNAKLVLAGSICTSKQLQIPNGLGANIELLGKFNNTIDVYSVASVAINPVQVGTGLKIKIIEALAHGLPVVSYIKSNDSLVIQGNTFNTILKMVDDVNEFVEQIFTTLQISSEETAQQTANYIETYNKANSETFFSVLET